MIHQSLLVATFVAWAVICLCGAVVLLHRAPAVSIALFGTVLGAIAGFLVGNADGPRRSPCVYGGGRERRSVRRRRRWPAHGRPRALPPRRCAGSRCRGSSSLPSPPRR